MTTIPTPSMDADFYPCIMGWSCRCGNRKLSQWVRPWGGGIGGEPGVLAQLWGCPWFTRVALGTHCLSDFMPPGIPRPGWGESQGPNRLNGPIGDTKAWG